MAENVEELTINWTDEADGKLKTKELKKEVLTKGTWATIMYLYQELNQKTDEFGEPKIRIQRYQKRDGVYQKKSKFNITNAKQAYQMIDIIKKWYPDNPTETK
ncbi:MAG: hypothetical protein ABIE74_02490 [Pseudomonadota bacterium]